MGDGFFAAADNGPFEPRPESLEGIIALREVGSANR